MQHDAHYRQTEPAAEDQLSNADPEDRVALHAGTGETAVQPLPQKQVAPVYPVSLVHPEASPVTVVAQLVMDKIGHVQRVYPVSDTASAADHALFETAVEHAAMQWTFTPLWMQKPNADGTYELTAKPFSLWYVFHFKIVNGKPIVETVER